MALALALAGLAALIAISLRANAALCSHPRLPMQFGPDGTPGWTAPRPWALAFTPALAAVILLPTALLAPDEPWATGFAAICLIGGHFLHLFLIRRTL